jgi:hypothetical protein
VALCAGSRLVSARAEPGPATAGAELAAERVPPPAAAEPRAFGATDEESRGGDSDDRPEDVQLKDVTGAYRARHDPADERPCDPEQDRESGTDALTPGQHKARKQTDDYADDDESENLHGDLFSASRAAKQPAGGYQLSVRLGNDDYYHE